MVGTLATLGLIAGIDAVPDRSGGLANSGDGNRPQPDSAYDGTLDSHGLLRKRRKGFAR